MAEKVILGIDEVGRGPWAGPLLVGAVILGVGFRQLPEYDELTDSKMLTAKKRERLAQTILGKAVATGFGWVQSVEIDRFGLGPALKLAARRAVKEILAAKAPFDEIVIDGTINLFADTPLADRVILLPKADLKVKEVSAASIIAKVARDRYMAELAEKYPEYGFEKHVGYGTALHRAALERLGACPEHRRSFRPIQKYLEMPVEISQESTISNTTRGQAAEKLVLEYLQSEGHQILAHNFRTQLYEIDLISVKDDTIYFTEVKSRLNQTHGAPLEQITAQKQRQIRLAATDFLADHSDFANLAPILAVASVSGQPPRLDEWFPLTE